jgi:hypothetical protein
MQTINRGHDCIIPNILIGVVILVIRPINPHLYVFYRRLKRLKAEKIPG